MEETTQAPISASALVLIVGGGPVGLCASLLLARHGIRSLLVERRPITFPFPRARGIDIRSMELLRTWGLEAEVRRKGYTHYPLAPIRDHRWEASLVIPGTLSPGARRNRRGLHPDSATRRRGRRLERVEPGLDDNLWGRYGHVAWRSATSAKEPVVELERVLRTVSGHEFH